jgi:hypothetical protein
LVIIERFEDLQNWQKAQLYLALNRQTMTEDEHRKAKNLATEVRKLINGMIAYLQK